ncbi:hypothetical protein [Methanofollis fontis]|uniref:Uncharacterized protein n=1 Tax=Methanofollis fontis TaxID=2052832 RepID=A0A483CRM7_9EURY|nr:hypothetical protein [Methanofollis fontis]TAJ43971.1 hypothetical protein CUJ86_07945 [Methanofollis fontis]
MSHEKNLLESHVEGFPGFISFFVFMFGFLFLVLIPFMLLIWETPTFSGFFLSVLPGALISYIGFGFIALSDMMYDRHFSPLRKALLSIFVPGLGQFYLGDVTRGIGLYSIWIFGLLLNVTHIFLLADVGLLIGFGAWAFAIYDGYRTGKGY